MGLATASPPTRKPAWTTALPTAPRWTPSWASAIHWIPTALTGQSVRLKRAAGSQVQTSTGRRWSRSQMTSCPSCPPQEAGTTACSLTWTWTSRSGQSWWKSWTAPWPTKTFRTSSTMALRTAKTRWTWPTPPVLLDQWSVQVQQREVVGASRPRLCSPLISAVLSQNFHQRRWLSIRTLGLAPPTSGQPPPVLLLTTQALPSPPPLPRPQLCPHPSHHLPQGNFSHHPTSFSLLAPQDPKTCHPPSICSSWLRSSREPTTFTASCSTNNSNRGTSFTTRCPMVTPQPGPRWLTPLRARWGARLEWTSSRALPCIHRTSTLMHRSSYWCLLSPTKHLQKQVLGVTWQEDTRGVLDTTCWDTLQQDPLSTTRQLLVLRLQLPCWATTTPNLFRTLRQVLVLDRPGSPIPRPRTRQPCWTCCGSSSRSNRRIWLSGNTYHMHRYHTHPHAHKQFVKPRWEVAQ